MKALLLVAALLLGGGTAYADVHFGFQVGVPILRPAPICGYYGGDIGFYDGNCGYWTGSDWDREWYGYGHGGYGRGHWHRDDRGHDWHSHDGWHRNHRDHGDRR